MADEGDMVMPGEQPAQAQGASDAGGAAMVPKGSGRGMKMCATGCGGQCAEEGRVTTNNTEFVFLVCEAILGRSDPLPIIRGLRHIRRPPGTSKLQIGIRALAFI